MAHGIGITKGGRNTKLHAVCDEKGRPHVLLLTPGNTHDAKVAMLAINAVPPSEYLVADKGYDSNALRTWLTRFGRNIKTFMATIAIAAFVTWRL
ncbi:transposase [Solilutibacter tolerans]|uniref:transposase n=1 Tax=Solilutibacter tolerans TaxID=1604334 RepID=UPI00097134C3|nr:transposase [Lysobacter tolerans]